MSQSLVTPEAVETLFKKMYECLPWYIPAMPSLKIGLIVTAIIVIIGLIIGLIDRNATKDKSDIIQRSRWIMILLIFVYIGMQVGDIVKDKHYTIACLAKNKQHFANVHWLKLYTEAVKLNKV